MKKRYINKIDRIVSLLLFIVGVSLIRSNLFGNFTLIMALFFCFSALTHFLSTIKEEIIVELKGKEDGNS